MTSSRLRSVCVPLILGLSLLSCSDDSTSPAPGPDDDHLTRESANSVSDVVGPLGGVLLTTANDGTVYTLTIPAAALPTGRTITMTPVTAIDNYPLAGGLAGGVELKPSGTVFAVPVTLTIETSKTPGAGEVPVAILFGGNATSFEPSLVGYSGGTLTIPMTHFSGGTAGFATAQELAAIMASEGLICLYPAIESASSNDLAAMFATFHSCFVNDVLPAIEGAGTDVALAIAISKYSMWKTDGRGALGIEKFATFDDAAETQQALDALVGKLQEAVIRNNQSCGTNQSLASLANVLFWQTQAARFGLDTVGNLLDRDTILRELCARPVVDTIVIPQDMQVGFPHSLDLQFGLLFNGQTDSQGVPFNVHLTGDGLDIQNPTGFTNAQGEYTTVITATRDGVLSVNARACLLYPGTEDESDVCVEETAESEGVDLNGNWSGSVVFSGSGSSPVCAILNQNQNSVSGTIEQVGGTASFTATLSGTQLLNVSIDGFFGEADCFTNGTGSVSNGTITIQVTPEAPCNTELVITYTLTRGSCP